MTASGPAPQPLTAQAMASDPAYSVWVSASAGSGKTTVLRNRFLRLLLHDALPQRILCLTFTKAAANEMTLRITGQLGQWAVMPEADLQKELKDLTGREPPPALLRKARGLFARVLDCPGGLRIKTFHAFAEDILQRFPIEAKVTPHFRLLEGVEEEQALAAVKEALYLCATSERETELGQALDQLAYERGASRCQDILQDIVANRHQYIAMFDGFGETLVARLWQRAGLPQGLTAEQLLEAINAETAAAIQSLRDVLQILSGGNKAQKVIADAAFLWLGSQKQKPDFFSYYHAWLTNEHEGRKYIDSKLSAHEWRQCEAEIERLKTCHDKFLLLKNTQTLFNILTVARAFLAEYQRYKDSLALLDFGDLIEKTVTLFTQAEAAAWVLYKLDGGLDHIMVDEAQDTAPCQWQMIDALVGEFFSGEGQRDYQRTLFVVGDEKQSIYSFQRADPAVFARQYRKYADHISAAGQDLKRVPLNVSFRSVDLVLKTVDSVFASEAMRAGVSEEDVKHHVWHKRSQVPGYVELWPLQAHSDAEQTEDADPWAMLQEYQKSRSPEAKVAEAIAVQIKQWLENKTPLPSRGRPIQAGDIMILVRNRTTKQSQIVRALKRHGVPVAGEDKMELSKTLVVQDMLALIQFVLLPEDDLTLASVLRGPLIGASEDDLFALAYHRGDQSLWQRLRQSAINTPPHAEWRDYLQQMLNHADQNGPPAFLIHCLNHPCPGSDRSGRHALLTRLGPDALDPLDELLNAAQQMESKPHHSLQHFLFAMQRLSGEVKRDQGQSNGLVRIMTVHGAKGLQAPIVFLADTMSHPDGKKQFMAWDDQHLPCYLASKSEADFLSKALKQTLQRKQQEEERRLLYVALTRAEDQLFIAGYFNKRKNDKTWYDQLVSALKSASLEEAQVAARIIPVLEQPPELILKSSYPMVDYTGDQQDFLVPPAQAMPIWAQQPVPGEEPRQRMKRPSALDADPAIFSAQPFAEAEAARFARGRAIHRLLQVLPDLPTDQRRTAGSKIMRQQAATIQPLDAEEMLEEVLRLMENPAFAPLFGPGSRAEVPVVGTIDRQAYSGQIDRLCVRDDAVWIVDFKTDRQPPEAVADIPLVYRNQLTVYAKLLRQIYPQLPVKAFLLWTTGPQLMEISV